MAINLSIVGILKVLVKLNLSNRLIYITAEISRYLSIQDVAWLLLTALDQIYSESTRSVVKAL